MTVEAIGLDEKTPWKTSVKYICVTINSKLRLNEHSVRKIQETTKLRGYFHPMNGWDSKLPFSVKTLIYLTVSMLAMM